VKEKDELDLVRNTLVLVWFSFKLKHYWYCCRCGLFNIKIRYLSILYFYRITYTQLRQLAA